MTDILTDNKPDYDIDEASPRPYIVLLTEIRGLVAKRIWTDTLMYAKLAHLRQEIEAELAHLQALASLVQNPDGSDGELVTALYDAIDWLFSHHEYLKAKGINKKQEKYFKKRWMRLNKTLAKARKVGE